MTATDLVADLRRRGLRIGLRPGGTTLLVTPRSRITVADRAAVTAHKPPLLGLLRAEGAGRSASPCGLCGACDWRREPAWGPRGEGRLLCGVKHLIGAGVDPHTVMAFSGHRTPSMLKRYHIIALDDLRAAAAKGSAYDGGAAKVAALGTRREHGE